MSLRMVEWGTLEKGSSRSIIHSLIITYTGEAFQTCRLGFSIFLVIQPTAMGYGGSLGLGTPTTEMTSL